MVETHHPRTIPLPEEGLSRPPSSAPAHHDGIPTLHEPWQQTHAPPQPKTPSLSLSPPAKGSGAISRLVDGVRRFRDDAYPERETMFARLATEQKPQTLLIACADSRVVPELITQTNPGELFVCRNIGNIVPAYGEMLGGVSAVVEYACVALEVTDIIVCGHSDCGAMKALLDPDTPTLAKMPTVTSWLRNAHAARSVVEATQPDLVGPERVQALIEQNVRTQVAHLGTHPSVAGRLATGKLAVHGWVYGIETGTITTMQGPGGPFVPIDRITPARPLEGEPLSSVPTL